MSYVRDLEDIADRVEDEGIAEEIRQIAFLISCEELSEIENRRY